ncbi:hypothetical protein GCM10009772_04770 [Pseudonocardia alni subsp. carboxydivorans]
MRVGDGAQHVPVRSRLQDEPEPPARVRGEGQRDPDELGVRRAADLVAVVVGRGDAPARPPDGGVGPADVEDHPAVHVEQGRRADPRVEEQRPQYGGQPVGAYGDGVPVTSHRSCGSRGPQRCWAGKNA